MSRAGEPQVRAAKSATSVSASGRNDEPRLLAQVRAATPLA